jgi:hypothetical protein
MSDMLHNVRRKSKGETPKQSISFTILIARNTASRNCQLPIADCQLALGVPA